MENLTDLRQLLEDARLETVAEAAGFEVSGRLLGDLIARLDVRQRRLWERLLETAPTLAECAAELGVSGVAIHRQEARLRKRLAAPGWSSGTTARTTTNSGRTAGWATSARRPSPRLTVRPRWREGGARPEPGMDFP